MAENKVPEETDPQTDNAVPAPLGEDAKTDSAVDEIQRSNSDAELEAAFTPEPVDKPNLWQKYLNHKKWTIPVSILVLLLVIIFGIPATRYSVLGIVFKRDYTLTVVDAKTNNVVSKATVKMGSQKFETDGEGRVKLKHLPVGAHHVEVSKQYYGSKMINFFVGLSKKHNAQKSQLPAIGRQVEIDIVNAISGQPIANAEVSALNTSAKTNSKGAAFLVLPANQSSVGLELSAEGYMSDGTRAVDAHAAYGNVYGLVPDGRVYFLSNASGKVDVVSTNYDGSDRQTLLAGTGFEDTSSSLIISPDTKSLMLSARRSINANFRGLYTINTSTSKMTTVEADANQYISSIGWAGDHFVYQKTSAIAPLWTPGASVIKSYNPNTGNAVVIDSTDAQGTNYSDVAYQRLTSGAIIDGQIVYAKGWLRGNASVDLSSKVQGIYSSQPNGSGKKILKELSVPAGSTYTYIDQQLSGSGTTYFGLPTTQSGYIADGAIYARYTKGVLTTLDNFGYNDFTNLPGKNVVAVSSDGSKVLYSDTIDGSVAASTTDSSGSNKKKIATLSSSGQVLGWLTNDYILVQDDELMLISGGPVDDSVQPLQVSNVYNTPRFN